jgi:hypothetical protein
MLIPNPTDPYPECLFQVELPTADAEVFRCPDGYIYVITGFTVTNTTAVAKTWNVALCPPGVTTPTVANRLAFGENVNANTRQAPTIRLVLQPGWTIRVFGSAAGVSMMMFGIVGRAPGSRAT